MARFIGVLVGLCVFTLGCEQSGGVFSLPTSPTGGTSAPAPTPSPAPQPRPFPVVDFTEIAVGQTVSKVISALPPKCWDWPEWPCQYFRFAAPSDGRVTVELRYRPETQPPGRNGPQGVDISVLDSFGREVWADFAGPDWTRATLDVKEGAIYQIQLWYTYPELAYELQTTLVEDDATGVMTVYFTSNRPGGLGGDDIYASILQPDETFGPAVLVAELSTLFNDSSPFIRRDGLECF